MPETVRSYKCGCRDGGGAFVPCRRAERQEHRMMEAQNELMGLYTFADQLAREPLTSTDPTYFEHEHSMAEQADKLSVVVETLRNMDRKREVRHSQEYRARRAIADHLSKQEADGAYTDEVIPDPPKPEFDQADLQ